MKQWAERRPPLPVLPDRGLGDLVATCVSTHSRNRYVGEQLGQGRSIGDILDEMNMVAEGVKTARTVHVLAERHGLEVPICESVYRVVNGEIGGHEAYDGLLSQRPGHESEPG